MGNASTPHDISRVIYVDHLHADGTQERPFHSIADASNRQHDIPDGTNFVNGQIAGPVKKITKSEFINGYCMRSGLQQYQNAGGYYLNERQYLAVTCNCEDSLCEGWRMMTRELI